jgi:hypothetical protein
MRQLRGMRRITKPKEMMRYVGANRVTEEGVSKSQDRSESCYSTTNKKTMRGRLQSPPLVSKGDLGVFTAA